MRLDRLIERIPFRHRSKLNGAVAANVGWLMADRCARLIITLVVGALTARYLGPDRFGSLAYALALIALLAALANLSADALVVRDLVRHRDKRGEIVGTVLLLRTAIGTLCLIGAVFIFWLLRDGAVATLLALAGGSLVFQATDTFDLWFQSELQSRRTVTAKFPAYMLSNLARVLLVLMHAPLEWFAAAYTFDAVMAAIFLTVSYRRFPVPEGLGASFRRARSLFIEALPFTLSGVSVIIYMRIDQVMLHDMVGMHELGLFAAAAPIATAWQFIPLALTSSLAPLVARRKLESEQAYRNALLNIYRGFLALSLLCSSATAIASPLIVPLLFGPAFESTIPVLAILAFTNVPVALGLAQTLWITNEPGGGYVALGKTLTGVVIAIAANFVLLPRYGAVGAAISANLSYCGSAIFSNLLLAPEVFFLQLGIDRRLPWRGMFRRRASQSHP